MIPVILINKGFPDYFSYVVKQASKCNSVYLIGDQNNIDSSNKNVNFVNKNELETDFNSFKGNYIHLNTTPVDFELFCYERWFLLKEFMSKNKLEVVFYIDSDVLLFVDVNKEWQKFSQYSMTLLHRTAAISSFITYKGLCDFCDMLLSVYKNKNGYLFKKIASHYKTRQECGLGGGVCDMTLFELFHYTHEFGGGPGRIGEMMQIINDSTYDHNINAKDQDFSFKNGLKEVKIDENSKKPFVFNERLKKNIWFNSLHFQGGAKDLIRNYCEQ